MKKILAWHFLKDDGSLQFEHNGKTIKPQAGQTLTFKGEPMLCQSGLHASRQLIDALKYAPGAILCRVELSGTVVVGDDKLVATKRRILWKLDATNVLHEMACRAAESVIDNIKDSAIKAPCVAAIKAKRAWLAGRISNDELSAAWSARSAWLAAWSARSAARSAESAAWSAQNRTLTRLVLAARRKAGRS